MAITRSKKEQTISKLSDLFAKAELMIFLGFRGLSVAKASELRRKLREAGASYMVAKKRLARLVLKEKSVDMPELEGEVAFIFSGGELAGGSSDAALAAAKAVHAFAKTNKEASVLGGILEMHVVDAGVITRLAQIPPREILLAQVVGVLQGPMRGLAAVFNGNQRKLVTVLKQISEKG